MNTANTMLGKRMKPYPYFYGYLNTIINAVNAKQTGENFENWQACVEKMLAAKSTHGVQEFFDMSENIETGLLTIDFINYGPGWTWNYCDPRKYNPVLFVSVLLNFIFGSTKPESESLVDK